LSDARDAGLGVGVTAVEVHPRVDVLVLAPVAPRLSRRAGALFALSCDGIEVVARCGVGHGGDAALALGGHDHGVGIVGGELVECVEEPIDGLVGPGFVLRDVQCDVTGVRDHHHLSGIHDLENGPERLVFIPEPVVFEAPAVDGRGKAGETASFLEECEGTVRFRLEGCVCLVHQNVDVVSRCGAR